MLKKLPKFGQYRKQTFEIVLRFKSDIVVSTFTFYFLSSPNLSLFLSRFFSSTLFYYSLFCRVCVCVCVCVCVWGGGDVFENTFRIIGFDGIKCRWVAEQDFIGQQFWGQLFIFFPVLID